MFELKALENLTVLLPVEPPVASEASTELGTYPFKCTSNAISS